jgi:putative FmdB family regulatory protein
MEVCMPVYSYICKKCNTEFDVLIGFEKSAKVTECKNCKSSDIVKKFSAFSVASAKKGCEGSDCASSSCDMGSCPGGTCSLG